jgi:putative addiction module antidote
MTHNLKIINVDDYAAVVLPPEVLTHLGVKAGDTLFVVPTPKGIELTPDRDFAEQMAVAEGVMRENHEVLRRLADG